MQTCKISAGYLQMCKIYTRFCVIYTILALNEILKLPSKEFMQGNSIL